MKTLFRIALLLGVLLLGILVGRVAFASEPALPCVDVIESGGARLRVVKPSGYVPRHYRVLSIATCRAVRAEAERQGLPVARALASAQHESHFDPFAIGPAGEIGPMQVKGMHCRRIGDCNPVEAGVAYLRSLVERAGGDRHRAFGAYRCGWAGSRSWPPQCRDYADVLTLREDRIRALFAHAEAPREGRRDRSASAVAMRLAPWARMHGAPTQREGERW